MEFPKKYLKAGSEDGGLFVIPYRGRDLKVIATNGAGWDHVSVSLNNRCPNWEEMSHVKNIFWGEEVCVMQLHPPKSEYVNNHRYCLHLWKPHNETIPMPPLFMVGVKWLELL